MFSQFHRFLDNQFSVFFNRCVYMYGLIREYSKNFSLYICTYVCIYVCVCVSIYIYGTILRLSIWNSMGSRRKRGSARTYQRHNILGLISHREWRANWTVTLGKYLIIFNSNNEHTTVCAGSVLLLEVIETMTSPLQLPVFSLCQGLFRFQIHLAG